MLCREPHDWRAISAHRLGDRADEFPGQAEVRDETQTTCQDEVRAYVDDPLETFDYGWLLPTEIRLGAGPAVRALLHRERRLSR